MKLTKPMLLGMIVIMVLLLVVTMVGKLVRGRLGKTRQAVFLTNGQVYFGYVSRQNAKMIRVKDIYYLQVQQQLQAPQTTKEQPQVSLVKLGNELHGPKDEMLINRDHLLFIEDMKPDSKVNQSIANYIKNGPSPAVTSAPPTVEPTL